MPIWNPIELGQARCKQRFHPPRIPPAMMVKGCGHLNQSLKEQFLFAGSREPQFFPHFVRLEILARVEERDPSPELSAVFHSSLVGFPLEFHGCRTRS
jgi:hypothetical protein